MDILDNSASERIAKDVLGLPQVPTSSVMDELREQSRQNGIKSLYYFSTAILGWDKVRQVPHLDICQFIQKIPKSRKVVLVPRDCYKSTIGSKSLPLWILVQPDFMGLPGLEHRMLLCSHSAVNAQKQIMSMMTQVERNQLLQWLYPEIIPDLSKTTWTRTNLLFPREGAYGEDTIEAAGIDTHLTSRHYTVQIKDDLEDQQSAEQPTVRERVKSFYRSAEALFVDEQTAFDLLIGTRWGIDDLYQDIKDRESEHYEFWTRPLMWTRELLEEDVRLAEEAKKPSVYDMDPEEFAPDPDKTYYFFPELFPKDSIKRIQDKQGQFMFSMLYMNNPRDPALAEFRESDFRYFTFSDEGDIVLQKDDGQYEVVPYDSLYRTLFWDPAMTEKEKKKRSRNAIVVAGFDNDGRIFIMDAVGQYINAAFLYTKYIGMHQRYRCHKAAVEDAGFQRVLKYPLYDLMDKQGYTFPVEGLVPVGDKDARIRTLQPYSESHRLYIRRGLTSLVQELRGFPVFPTKDLIDAAAATLSLKKMMPKQVQSKRRGRVIEDSRLMTRSAVTGY